MKKTADKNALFIIKNLLLITIGTVVLAFGTSVFIIPNNLIVGGISGIAIILDLVLPFEFLTVDLIITVLTWLLFFMGLIFLGKSFALKTLVSAIIYPIAISLFMRLSDAEVLGGFFTMQEYSELSLILSALFGGVCIGSGCALAFLGGGSTGGIDIVAFLVCKVFRRIKSSAVIFILDSLIVVLGVFVIRDLALTLLGIVCVFVSAVMIDKVFIGSKSAFIAQIITTKYEVINRAVIEELNRTTTVFDAVGGFSGAEYKMLMVSFSIREYSDLIGVIAKHDRRAFVTVYKAHEINGEGWN